MAAVLSPHANTSSPSPSPSALPPRSSPSPAVSLPPLVTSPPSRPSASRIPSYAKNRLSTFSMNSAPSSKSRPQSTVFPLFHSSLPYALVRDFAYPPFHPLHYGPPPDEPSGMSTPASEHQRRLSDPPPSWDGSRGQWSAGPWGGDGGYGQHLPSTSFGDGPPYEEDEDLHSPVVTSSKHKKHKSNMVEFDQSRGRRRESVQDHRQSQFAGLNGDGSSNYYLHEPNETAGGPGGEYITFPPAHQNSLQVPDSQHDPRRDSHFAATLPNRSYPSQNDFSPEDPSPSDESDLSPSEAESPYHDFYTDESRYSRDYQFTIASPDEEMHGKAVALFDFERENENELPLIEGQVILVSYRHGQGWLVAQDPKTGESGLVPEAYVRLLRDIEGGWQGLNGLTHADSGLMSPVSQSGEGFNATTPTQSDWPAGTTSRGGDKEGRYTPVVSSFSTSSKDFEERFTKEQIQEERERANSSPERRSKIQETVEKTVDDQVEQLQEEGQHQMNVEKEAKNEEEKVEAR